jgi:chemotaxis protein MotA
MDFASIFGLFAGVTLIFLAIRENFFLFLSAPAAMITFGGAFAATCLHFPIGDVMKVMKIVSKVFFTRPHNPYDAVETIVGLAEKARREGFLALEAELANVNDEFLKRGVQNVIDGVSRDEIKDTLTKQLEFLAARHESGQEILVSIGTYTPAFGMAGTLIGLVIMLYNLDDPKKVGPGMALAIITTMYGVLAAYLFLIPMAGKLKVRAQQEAIIKEVTIEGIISLHAGEAPRLMREKLHAYLDPRMKKMPIGGAKAPSSPDSGAPEKKTETKEEKKETT